jgi:hypothetical protein
MLPYTFTLPLVIAAACLSSPLWDDNQPMRLAKRQAAKQRKQSRKKRKHGHGNQG